MCEIIHGLLPSPPHSPAGARNAHHLKDLRQVSLLQLDEEDVLDIDAAYEGAEKQPQHDCFIWERGGPW